MRFEWDPLKAKTNLEKHGIAFEEAELVWRDPLYLVYFDRIEGGEERRWAVGRVGPAMTLVVVHV
jgi:uncharacterized DUF497 family protein